MGFMPSDRRHAGAVALGATCVSVALAVVFDAAVVRHWPWPALVIPWVLLLVLGVWLLIWGSRGQEGWWAWKMTDQDFRDLFY